MPLQPCRVCGKQVSLDATVCPGCGANRPTMKAKEIIIGCSCHACGERVNLDEKTCPSCGINHPAISGKRAGIGCAVILAISLLVAAFGALFSAGSTGPSFDPVFDRFAHQAPTQTPMTLTMEKISLKGDTLVSQFALRNLGDDSISGQLQVEFFSPELPAGSELGGLRHVFFIDEPLSSGKRRSLTWELTMPGLRLKEFRPTHWQWKFATEEGVIASR